MTVRVVSPRLACFILDLQTKAPPEDGAGEGHGTAAGARRHSLRNALCDDLTMAGLDEGTVVPVQRSTSWPGECVCSDTDPTARL